MKKILVIIIFFSLYQWKIFGQTEIPKVKFGQVTKEEIETKYDKDTSVNAIVIYDGGEYFFEITGKDIYITCIIHQKIKIINKSALDKGSFSLTTKRGVNSVNENITDIKGFTYNIINGEIVKDKLTKDMIFKEKITDEYFTQKIIMPNVKEGSLIEYSYKRQIPFSHNTNPQTWYFQQDIPVVQSDYTITIPEYFYYRMLQGGYLPMTNNFNKKVHIGEFNTEGTEYRFVMKDVPPFVNEEYIPNIRDYVSKIDFELASVNWPGILIRDISLDYLSVCKTLLNDASFGGVLEKNEPIKDILKTFTMTNDTLENINLAVKHLHKNIKFNESFSMYSAGFKKTIEKKEGDGGDINLMLIAILREMGYDAHPVILSTRGHGNINKQYALLKKFNYTVAHMTLNGKDLFIDATDPFIKVGTLPEYCLSYDGYLVHPTRSRFISLETTDKSILFEKVDLKFNEDNEVIGNLSKTYSGYFAIDIRNEIKKNGKEKYLEEVKKARQEWNISSAEVINIDDLNKNLEAKYEVKLTEFTTEAGNLMYVKPMLSSGIKENPFKSETREFPIDFAYPSEQTFMVTFTLPSDYVVQELPQPAAFTLPENGARFTYMVGKKDNTITITSKINFKKSIYGAGEYTTMKEFYERIVKKHAEQIVLKKI